MLSAVGQDKITQKAINLGAEYYVVKPFDIELLIKRIREIKLYKPGQGNSFVTKETKQQYIERITDEINNRKPSISKNHYYYSNCFDEGLEDTEHYMNKTANELMSMAAATPKDIFIANEENGTDVIFWLTRELEDKREWLDENIVSNCFAKLCERYEDTIKIL